MTVAAGRIIREDEMRTTNGKLCIWLGRTVDGHQLAIDFTRDYKSPKVMLSNLLNDFRQIMRVLAPW